MPRTPCRAPSSRDITYTEPWVGAIVVIGVLFALRAIDEPDRRWDLDCRCGLGDRWQL